MSIGSYIANAAEAHRNRMFQSSESEKNRALQKYNIDQTTGLRNEIMQYDFDKLKKGDETWEGFMKLKLGNLNQRELDAKRLEEWTKANKTPGLGESLMDLFFNPRQIVDPNFKRDPSGSILSSGITPSMVDNPEFKNKMFYYLQDLVGKKPTAEQSLGTTVWEDPSKYRNLLSQVQSPEEWARISKILEQDPGVTKGTNTYDLIRKAYSNELNLGDK